MKKLIIASLLLSVCSALLLIPSDAASASDLSKWTWEDTALQTVYSGLVAADYAQTLHITRDPVHYYEAEADRFIGKYPSKRKVNAYFSAMLLGHTAISYLLPKPYRTIWQGAYISYEYNTIQENRSIGLGISLHY